MKNKIKEYRTVLGITQEQLAERVDCSVRAIRYYEADKLRPSAITIIRIAKALNTTVEEMYSEEENAATVLPVSKRRGIEI